VFVENRGLADVQTDPARASSGRIGGPRSRTANRCTHRIVELTLTSNRSAASCRDAAASTKAATRSRRSREYGFDMPPSTANHCAKTHSSITHWDSYRFHSDGYVV
jgi:hypothetical protein